MNIEKVQKIQTMVVRRLHFNAAELRKLRRAGAGLGFAMAGPLPAIAYTRY